MIAFRNNNKEDLINKLQKVLNSIYEDEYYSGSFHEDVDISEIIQIIYKVLYDSNNRTLKLTVEKKENNSLDLIIENIK